MHECYSEFLSVMVRLEHICWCLFLFVCFCCVDQGLTIYNGTKAVINASVFHPSQLTEDRMLYFWFSDDVLNPLTAAAHHDGRFIRNITGAELTVHTSVKIDQYNLRLFDRLL